MPELHSNSHDGSTDALRIPLLPNTSVTNAVNRGLSDLHVPTWLELLAANITTRTIIFHPLQLSLVRKRVTRAEKPPTVFAQIRAAYKGGIVSFPSVVCKGGFPETPPVRKDSGVCDLGKGGVRGCYRGLGAALVANLIGEVGYLLTLETFMESMARSSDSMLFPNALSSDQKGADELQDSVRSRKERSEKEGFWTPTLSAAVGAMLGDLVSLLMITPVVIICNRQMTAGYGMAAGSRYQGAYSTLNEVWHLYQGDRKRVVTSSSHGLFDFPAPFRSKWLWCKNGFKGIYQGFNAGLIRIPSSGCWWGIYTKTKEGLYALATPSLTQLQRKRASDEVESGKVQNEEARNGFASLWQYNWFFSPSDNPLLNATASAVASICTTVLFNPIAVIQTRLQVLPESYWSERLTAANVASTDQGAVATRVCINSETGTKSTKRHSTTHPLKRIHIIASDLIQKEGFRGFFKGASVNIAVAVLDGIVFSLVFEFTKLGSDKQFITNGSPV